MASSHPIGSNRPSPRSPIRLSGWRTRSGWYSSVTPARPRGQSVPRFTGWPGRPSSLTTCPFTTRATTPQPAGQSWQTEGIHRSGSRGGRISSSAGGGRPKSLCLSTFSAASAVVAMRPVKPKNARRVNSMSAMAGETIRRHMLLSMALQAALHRDGDGLPDDGTCHHAHIAVADGALKLGLCHMALVRKVHMSGKPVDLLPRNLLTTLCNLLELRLHLGQPRGPGPYSGVAFQAVVHGGDPSEGLALGVHMAGGTRQFS